MANFATGRCPFFGVSEFWTGDNLGGLHFSEFPNSAKTSKPRAWLASFGSREIALANCNPRVCEGGTDYVIKNDRVQEALPVRARVVTNSTDFGGAGECKPGAWLAGVATPAPSMNWLTI